MKMTRKSKTRKQEEAEQRQMRYDKLSLEEKLKRALQNGHPESREVKRLRKQIEQQHQKVGRRNRTTVSEGDQQ